MTNHGLGRGIGSAVVHRETCPQYKRMKHRGHWSWADQFATVEDVESALPPWLSGCKRCHPFIGKSS